MTNSSSGTYNTVCPYLMVDQIEKQMEFLQTVFNAVIKENLKNADGVVLHGEVVIGDTVIMLGRGSADFPSQPSMNYIFVDHVDQVYQKAMDHGAKSIYKPADRFYGLREAGFKDMHHNTWFIAEHIKDVSIEDMEKGFADKKV